MGDVIARDTLISYDETHESMNLMLREFLFGSSIKF